MKLIVTYISSRKSCSELSKNYINIFVIIISTVLWVII
jgi:hypothetical protein